jgi:hypothetical protein
LQVSVEVIVSNVPWCIDHVPEYFVLESLYNVYIALFGETPELDTVCMSKEVLGTFGQSAELLMSRHVVYIDTIRF